ncbi:MAG: hypothetical protein H7246_07015 [Phycisphaerae bacterium]|nr:hypothetical protein [Saprospiraceae bacterium]
MKNILPLLAFLLALAACAPFEENDVDLPAQPEAPIFSLEFLNGDSNRVIVTNLSTGFFDHTFDFPGGIPAKSKRAVDTVFYTQAGDFVVTLYAAAEGGGGVSSTSKIVHIYKDAKAPCDPLASLLTGSCEAPGRCWTFTHAAEAVRVGPTPGSKEWYKSPVNGLQTAQYDDQFCFYFEGAKFEYKNNGFSVDPWNQYAAVPYTPAANQTWFISKGSGDGGKDQIVLPAGAFIGTWDSGPVYDIVSLTETEMVLRSPIRKQDGTPADGWFEFTLVKI